MTSAWVLLACIVFCGICILRNTAFNTHAGKQVCPVSCSSGTPSSQCPSDNRPGLLSLILFVWYDNDVRCPTFVKNFVDLNAFLVKKKKKSQIPKTFSHDAIVYMETPLANGGGPQATIILTFYLI